MLPPHTTEEALNGNYITGVSAGRGNHDVKEEFVSATSSNLSEEEVNYGHDGNLRLSRSTQVYTHVRQYGGVAV